MTNPEEKQTADERGGRQSQVPLMFFEGPWTKADENWVKCMTGEYDRRVLREIHEREAQEADL